MGTLRPGATYVYEKHDGITYAREIGAPPQNRFEIGRDYPNESTFLGLPVSQVAELVGLAEAAKNNPALQEALERAKMLYLLSKNYE